MCLNRVFSIKELEELDEKQLAILDDAIRREIHTSDEITKMLRKKVKASLYDRWVPKGRPRRGRRAPAKGK
jgi:hypothetical protein